MRRSRDAACTSRSSWTATAAGRRRGACRARRAPARASRGAAHRRGARPRRHRHAHALRVLLRQLERPRRRGAARSCGCSRATCAARPRASPSRACACPSIGRRDRLPARCVARSSARRRATARGRDAAAAPRRRLLGARRDPARRRGASAPRPPPTREAFALGCRARARRPAPDVDLLIRTGGEQRLSDFLLWECAYAELCSGRRGRTSTPRDLAAAVARFRKRQRRFGGLPEAVSA